MTFTNLLSLEQLVAMKEPFAAVEITDADFNLSASNMCM
jgi:hypothetical protein